MTEALRIYNIADNDSRRRAGKNVDAAIETEIHFPKNVFRADWNLFFFFESDLLFAREFVAVLKVLLVCESSVSVCMRNIDVAERNPERASLFLDEEISPEDYMTHLMGEGPSSGWIYAVDRYAFASNVGSWAIYCERNNEIAVIALRGRGVMTQLAPALEKLEALPIKEAIEKPPSYGLTSLGSTEEWRKILLQEYGPRTEEVT